jgi:hypothetical protein
MVRGEPTCRPGSVHPRKRGPAAIHLGLPLPAASCGPPASIGRATLNRSRRPRAPEGARPLWPCSRWGLPSHPDHSGRWWSLTPPFHPCPGPAEAGPGRSVFCGTVPRVTPGRRYRPPCPVEPGPSSPGHDWHALARPPGRLALSLRIGAHPARKAVGWGHHKPGGPECRSGSLPLADPPFPAAESIASLARRSAWVLRSRGTQV